MRKNTARHWLHAGLDLLPLILIPVFMIYSHRHTIDSGSIEVPVNRVVDFNQLYQPQNKTISSGGYDYILEDYSITIDGYSNTYVSTSINGFVDVDFNHKYFIGRTIANSGISLLLNGFNDSTWVKSFSADVGNGNIITIDDVSVNRCTIEIATYDLNVNNISFDIILCDLTQMFGVGNEPTVQQFNSWYSNDYYAYTLSHKELLKGYSTQTYDATDIMSQFTYQLYNSVDKYFNMGNVFGMSNVYDWFNLNIFGGNASISIYIVWNIVLYEFVMDLLFLLYALFMWFIDVTKRLIEKPLDSIK